MLIVEGTDGVGKTTLCQRLVKELEVHGPWIYSHFGKLPSTWDYPWSYIPRISQYVVQDRFHMSEIAYRVARGEEQQLHPEAYRLVDAYLRMSGSCTVVITQSPSTLKRLWKEDSNGVTIEQAHLANVEFMNLISNQITMHKYTVDFDIWWTPHDDITYPAEDDNFVRNILTRYLRR